jgi:uncharacterized protein YtpQ (UPF0354 family)
MGILGALSGFFGARQAEAQGPIPKNRDNVVALVRSFTELRPDQVLRVQSITALQGLSIPKMQVPADQLPLMDTFVGDLHIRYAFDSPKGVINLSERDLKELGLNREQLLPLAIANYRKLYPQMTVERPNAVIGMLTRGGELEASMMLDAEFWEKEKQQFGGQLVATVPARDVLTWTGLEPLQNVRELKRISLNTHSQVGRSALSRLVFLWRDRKWEVLDV